MAWHRIPEGLDSAAFNAALEFAGARGALELCCARAAQPPENARSLWSG